MTKDRAAQAVGENARSVVVNEKLNRTSFRGVVDIVYGGPAAEPREPNKPGKPKKAAKGKKGQTQLGTPTTSENGGKRKANDMSTNDQDPPTISKTKAKKMKLEAFKTEKEQASEETEIQDTSGSLTNG